MRKGIINPNNPSQIAWSNPVNFTGFNGYRCSAASDSLGNVYFIGGSSISYNYDGIAYNSTAGVNPNNNIIYFNTQNQQWGVNSGQVLPMDLRGIAEVSGVTKYIVGGMESGQLVSNKTIALHFVNANALAELEDSGIKIYPNPSQGVINFECSFEEDFTCEIYNSTGLLVYNKKMSPKAILNKYSIDLANASAGLYTMRLRSSKIKLSRNIVITP